MKVLDLFVARERWLEYVSWSLHHGYKDHLSLKEWNQAWNAGVIR